MRPDKENRPLRVVVIAIIAWIILLPWCTHAYSTEQQVYKDLITYKVLNIHEAKQIHSVLEVTRDCKKKSNWYITFEGEGKDTKIEVIVMNVCTEKEYRYLLLHEIWHYIHSLYPTKKLASINNSSYSRVSPEEKWAEDFALLYY